MTRTLHFRCPHPDRIETYRLIFDPLPPHLHEPVDVVLCLSCADHVLHALDAAMEGRTEQTGDAS